MRRYGNNFVSLKHFLENELVHSMSLLVFVISSFSETSPQSTIKSLAHDGKLSMFGINLVDDTVSNSSKGCGSFILSLSALISKHTIDADRGDVSTIL